MSKPAPDPVSSAPNSGVYDTSPEPVNVRSRGYEPMLEVADARAPAAAQGGQTELLNVARMVHRSLRGRYILTFLCAVILGGLGAAAGWYKVRPVYRSEGLLRIAYQMPEVMQETDQNAPLQMFDAFMFSQRLLITSRRVIDMAVQDPIWKATGRRLPDQPDRYFSEHLDVDIKPRGEFIQIAVRDEDPGTAAAAVTAVTNAYTELYSTQDKQLERQRTGVLEDRQTALQGRVDQLGAQLKTSTEAFGTDDLSQFFDAGMAKVMRLEATMNEFELALAAGVTSANKPATRPATRPQEELVLTTEQIAAIDPELRRLLNEQARLQDELEHELSLGLGEAHRQIINTRAALTKAHARATQQEAFFREYRKVTGRNTPETNVPLQTADKSPEQLKSDIARLKGLLETAKADMVKTGNQQLALQRLRDDLNVAREQLTQLTKRAGVLRTEGSLGGRLSVISSGEIALTPERDSRIKVTTAGGLAGVLLATGGMIGLGFLRGRFQYADESASRIGDTATMLGMLPNLYKADAARKAAAAHAIHQIRVLLQSRAERRRSSVYLITSSTSGEGKTSFAMALALSASASGMRTLLIDCDLVGRHLTAGLGGENRIGLREALEAGTIGGHLHRLRKNLRVLGTGRVRGGDASCVSAARMRALIQEARMTFDIVLIDSGPILGSLEAAVLASEVDSAIMLITKGQRHDLVRHSMLRLRSLGLPAAGFVYNRATAGDFDGSPMSSTSSSRVLSVASTALAVRTEPTGTASPRPTAANDAPATPDSLSNFGPLVQAIEAELTSGVSA